MDVSAVLTFLSLCLLAGARTQEVTSPPGTSVETSTAGGASTASVASTVSDASLVAANTTSNNDTETKTHGSCVTGFDDPGVCVDRQFCDYGTRAVDRTLYAKHNYVKVCTGSDVCCPQQFILPTPEPKVDVDDDDADGFRNENRTFTDEETFEAEE